MKVIITATTEKGKKAIKDIGEKGKDKNLEIKDGEMIITIPKHIAPFIRLIKNKFGINPQYEDFIELQFKSVGATKKDYIYKVE